MGGYGIAGAGDGAAASLLKLGWTYKAPGFYVKEPAGLQDALQAVQALAQADGVSGCHLFAYTERVDLGQALAGQAEQPAAPFAAASRAAQMPPAFGFGDPYGAQMHAAAPQDPLAALLASGMLDGDDELPSDAGEGAGGDDDGASDDANALSQAEQEARDEEEYALQMMQEMGLR